MPYDSRAAQPGEIILANARLILETETVTGSLLVRNGEIAAVDTGAAVSPGAIDCDGDFLAPGLVELHTDNLEQHLEPRPAVAWPHAAAIVAHDSELSGCGITTVFDALRVGSSVSGRGQAPYARALATEIRRLDRAGTLRLSHRLHLRAETCSETLIEELDGFGPEDEVGLLSLMDHTPGRRQFRDLAKLRVYTMGQRTITDAEFDALVAARLATSARFQAVHEAAAVAAAHRLGATLASHDDTTPEQVEVSRCHGTRIAEFPTTLAAATACRAAGIAVMMGAPNLIRGQSHSGNVSALELAEAGVLDVLSSDYAPASLLLGAVRLGEALGDIAAGLATVTSAPADATGLADRGRLLPGLRADLLRFRMTAGLPLPRGVWVAGERVA